MYDGSVEVQEVELGGGGDEVVVESGGGLDDVLDVEDVLVESGAVLDGGVAVLVEYGPTPSLICARNRA